MRLGGPFEDGAVLGVDGVERAAHVGAVEHEGLAGPAFAEPDRDLLERRGPALADLLDDRRRVCQGRGVDRGPVRTPHPLRCDHAEQPGCLAAAHQRTSVWLAPGLALPGRRVTFIARRSNSASISASDAPLARAATIAK